MKIEKVSENQIRCTLTKEDLASRQIKISELAYGTDKAKSLFRDMMQQANFEFGFEAEDIPLMIEAIPMNAECIVLIITKVEDPEELDTRFSRFAPSVHDSDDMEDIDTEPIKDDVLDLFKRIQASDLIPGQETTADISKETASKDIPRQLIRLFQFSSLHSIMKLASRVYTPHAGTFRLYKDPRLGKYLLLMTHSSENAEDFNRLCNITSEYGALKKVMPATPAYLEEHCNVVIADDALRVLSEICK